jgi:hypothetical protein
MNELEELVEVLMLKSTMYETQKFQLVDGRHMYKLIFVDKPVNYNKNQLTLPFQGEYKKEKNEEI